MMKTLIFDFDGTLVNSMQLYVNGFNQVGADFGLPKIDSNNLQEMKQSSIKDLMKRYKIGPLKLAKLMLTVNKNIASEITNLEFFPNIKELLLELAKKYQLGILTSNHVENVEAFLKKQQFENIFDFVYASKNLFGKDKILNSLLKKYRLNKEEVLYFGDEVRDIEACQKMQIKIAAVTWGFNEKSLLASKKPSYLFSSPDEIVDLLI
ncbi:MAG: Phosphoglycolate phosphatase [Candidatus Pacebacteria bacterium GW2011_GWF2_38_9]|nr:MAG: HAD-superfamily hydrolase, subfamily IA, variant 1 [candidate division TM6 bacterium GW2011_GWF2_28_16]KKQ10349.1 MAG: Phosphoglycolate phosphatase [Candidatus Pacebacteria bacterium GW2011_GWF1_36_5]KKQ88713.1 MAG: Phosphoglycolate phosphatase [Candidatus Pacebacteria bacterium GW2011_GWF2_38_9]HAZ73642.1 carotenoid oxygenase [Candidatus Paceibacterota bacterium]